MALVYVVFCGGYWHWLGVFPTLRQSWNFVLSGDFFGFDEFHKLLVFG